jgi:hypothetical protein
MKRSEMVNLIADAISMIRREDAINSSINSGIVHEQEYACLLLHKIEKATQKTTLGQWEPEDEA